MFRFQSGDVTMSDGKITEYIIKAIIFWDINIF